MVSIPSNLVCFGALFNLLLPTSDIQSFTIGPVICLQNWSYFPFSLNYSCPQRWKPGFNSSTILLSLPTAPCNFASRKVISQMLSVTPDNRVVASAILSECIFSELSKETRLTDHLCFCASIYVYWLNINFIKVLHALRDIQIKYPYFVIWMKCYTKNGVQNSGKMIITV